MGAWHHVVLLCSLTVGCGGQLPEEAIQEDERPEARSPSEEEDGEAAAQGNRPALGTPRLVKDLFPPLSGPAWYGPHPENLVELRGRLFFAANFEDGRRELWTSDGTPEGTAPIKQFPPLSGPIFSSSLTQLTPLGTRLFFVVNDETHGSELWVSDGTPGGTRLVKDIAPGQEDSGAYNLKAVGSTLLFFRYVSATTTTPARNELWRSDGTDTGTVMVKDLGPDASLIFSQAIVGNTLFFALSDAAHGSELWKSDGTEAGTGLVKDIVPGPDSSNPFSLRAVGQHVFFTAAEASHGTELWRTDGTEAGTTLVADLLPGPDSSFPQLLAPAGCDLYLTTRDTANRSMRLYRLRNDATGVNVKFVAPLPNSSIDPDTSLSVTTSTVANGKLFLALSLQGMGPAPLDTQLWVSDGTSAGTKLLHHPLSLSDEFGSTLYTLDDRVLFSGSDDANGLEPWVSDGTENGTRRVRDIAPGATSSFPRDFTRVGSKVFFVANDAVHGNELWLLPLVNSQDGANASLQP
ncbi:hypothetical protein JQX13_01260 [Archangium violaceum]|uniref:ELWxxDGT repeat protein n=1 Tax=Archangium violaceum TaxID=83451 RepID=UPI00193AF86A|nr:ELWxxDGT repeat protein [Archangium violaceum]QRK08832.1 hypothetical protein JQX13_01260 [Archangium violaceum]